MNELLCWDDDGRYHFLFGDEIETVDIQDSDDGYKVAVTRLTEPQKELALKLASDIQVLYFADAHILKAIMPGYKMPLLASRQSDGLAIYFAEWLDIIAYVCMFAAWIMVADIDLNGLTANGYEVVFTFDNC